MQEGELKIYYHAPLIDRQLEHHLRDMMWNLGFARGSENYDLKNDLRQLTFWQIEEEGKEG